MNRTVDKGNWAAACSRRMQRSRAQIQKVKTAVKKTPKKKKICFLVALILTAAAVSSAIAVFAGKDVNAQMVQTAKATKGSISNTVVGSGNLELGSSTDIEIPSGIAIEEVLVESGDQVSKGDSLAKVNRTSVLKVLSQTQEQIEQTDASIGEKKGDTESSVITAGVAGRVKRIYAAKGDSVLECVSDSGALLLLSVDGKMAVSIKDADGLSAGDTVQVILSDGAAKKTGTVESMTNGTAVITLTDNGPELDEKVTVKKGGSAIGTGKLYIHSQLAVVGTGGTVKSVKVSENELVQAGTTLYTLKNMPASVEYQELLAQRQDLSEILSSLAVMAQTGTITASESGTIEAVNVSSGSSGSSNTDSDNSASDTGVQGNTAAIGTSAIKTAAITTADSRKSLNLVAVGERKETETADSWDDSQTNAPAEAKAAQEDAVAAVISSAEVPITAPIKGASPQTAVASTDQFTGTISWNMKTETFQADSTYTARITLTAKKGCTFSQATAVSVGASGAVVSGVSVDGTGEGNTMTFTVTFTKTEKDTANTKTDPSENKKENKKASTSSNSTGTSLKKSADSSAANSLSASSGASTGSSAESSSSDTSAASSDTIETVAAFSFCSDEEMILPVSVDELDILSVEKGQEAEVTFDAIEGKTFTGKITKVSNAASVNSGTAKYSVDITLSADDSMRVGMNGSATVTISSKEDIILLPLSALQESGDKTFVYTQQDKEGNLSGKKEVEIGISDGSNAEITSGLSEGDTVYYTRSGAISQSTESGDGPGGGFGGGQMGSGGPDEKMGSGGRQGGSAPGKQ